ncbi:MAG TPA: MBL fold metallo-hydrolase [Spirochaetota bacterium]
MNAWYTHESLGHGLWAIDEKGMDRMYLINGISHALMIDTGWGLADVKKYIRTITQLPLIVVNTHGHPDHVSGNYLFDKVYIAKEDIMNQSFARDIREMKSRTAIRELPDWFNREEWCAKTFTTPVIMKDGDLFDLGDTIIEVLSAPGHTAGSVALIDRTRRVLFAGDSVLVGEIWMHGAAAMPLTVYRDSLVRLRECADRFDYVLAGHTDKKYDCSTIMRLIECINQILKGTRSGEPYHTFAGDGLACDFGDVRIVYRHDRLE